MKYYTILYYTIISTIRYEILDIKALWPDFGVEGGALLEEYKEVEEEEEEEGELFSWCVCSSLSIETQ